MTVHIQSISRLTLQECSMSATARLLRLAVAITSSWRQEFPAATALAVASVMPLVMRINSSGVAVFGGGSGLLNTWTQAKHKVFFHSLFFVPVVFIYNNILFHFNVVINWFCVFSAQLSEIVFLTASSCLMCSMVASSARVPLVASSSTAFTVFSRDVTFVTITWFHRNSTHENSWNTYVLWLMMLSHWRRCLKYLIKGK